MTALDSTAGRSAPKARPGAILTLLSVAQFMVFLCISSVNLALPAIKADLGMSDVSLNYIITIYATVLGGFLLLGGRLADTFGRRRVLNIGFVLFALASVLAALAPNGVTLIVSRGLTGLAAALAAPAALSILTNTFAEGAPRNKALGVWGSLAGIASILGVILGGLLAQGPGWEWIFWINVLVGLVAAAVSPGVVPESRAEKRRRSFDTTGAVVFTAALLLLIFTLGEANRVGWGTFRTIGSLVAVAVLLAVFLVIEAKVKSPIIPLRIFRLKTMRTANISALLVFGTSTALYFFASLFMQQAFGYSPMEAGLAYVPLAVAVAIGATLASSLMSKIAARPLLVAGLAVTIVGLLLLWQAPADGSYAVDLMPGLVLIGLGNGACFVTLQIAAFVGVSNEDAGLGAGLINTSQEAGGALGLSVVVTIAFAGLGSALAAAGGDPTLIRQAHASANHAAFLICAIVGILALLVAAFIMPRGKASNTWSASASPEAAPAAPVASNQHSSRIS